MNTFTLEFLDPNIEKSFIENSKNQEKRMFNTF